MNTIRFSGVSAFSYVWNKNDKESDFYRFYSAARSGLSGFICGYKVNVLDVQNFLRENNNLTKYKNTFFYKEFHKKIENRHVENLQSDSFSGILGCLPKILECFLIILGCNRIRNYNSRYQRFPSYFRHYNSRYQRFPSYSRVNMATLLLAPTVRIGHASPHSVAPPLYYPVAPPLYYPVAPQPQPQPPLYYSVAPQQSPPQPQPSSPPPPPPPPYDSVAPPTHYSPAD